MHIVVVDDNEDYIEFAKKQFAGPEYKLFATTDCEEALAYIGQCGRGEAGHEPLDAILTDLFMPLPKEWHGTDDRTEKISRNF